MSRKLPVINGVRGICALGIVAYHIIQPMYPPPGPLLWWGDHLIFNRTFLLNGERIVDLFFLLSGFVLLLPYIQNKRAMETFGDVKDFYVRRARRLFPLYYVNIAVAFIFVGASAPQVWQFFRQLFLYLTFTFHFFKDTWFLPKNGVLWSLGVEVWLSVLFPFIVLGIRRFGLTRTMIPLFILSMIIQYIPISSMGVGINYISDNVLGRLDDFCLGMLLAYAYVKNWRPLGEGMFVVGVAATITGFLACEQARAGYLHPYVFFPVMKNLCTLGFFCMLLAVLQKGRGFVHAFLSNRPLQLAGMMCYSIYVWHAIAMGHFQPSRSLHNLLYYIVALSVLCWFSYRYIEFGHVKEWRKLLPAHPRRSAEATTENMPAPLTDLVLQPEKIPAAL